MAELGGDSSIQVSQVLAYARELRGLYAAAQVHAERLQLLIELGEQFVAAGSVEALLRLALERATALSGHDGGSVLLLAGPDGPLEICAAIGANLAPVGTRIDEAYGSIVWRALRDRRPVLVEGPGDAIGLSPPRYHTPIASSICLPLVTSGGQAIGVLALKSSATPVRLDDRDQDALRLLSTQLATAIERVRLHEQLQDLVGRLLSAQEEERRRVAYEVHDGLAQVAASAHLNLQAYAHRHRPRSPHARAQLDRLLGEVQRTVQEARRIIAGLRPTALDDFGLAAAVRLEVEGLRATGCAVSYQDGIGGLRLAPPIETGLFRVAQEAISNVRKYAQAARAEVSLQRRGEALHLRVRDWGQGFDPLTVLAGGGPSERVGIAGMRERIALLSGRCTIGSQPGLGTTVEAEVPLPVQPEP